VFKPLLYPVVWILFTLKPGAREAVVVVVIATPVQWVEVVLM
jgi:hypothetical protein